MNSERLKGLINYLRDNKYDDNIQVAMIKTLETILSETDDYDIELLVNLVGFES